MQNLTLTSYMAPLSRCPARLPFFASTSATLRMFLFNGAVGADPCVAPTTGLNGLFERPSDGAAWVLAQPPMWKGTRIER